ncbi:MAG: hypothetical protein WDN00_06395 [Limisphaerales bacterium]
MKKTLLLTLALGVASALPLQAVDLYITGSTAFRANVYGACTKLFASPPTIVYGDSTHGGDANNNSSTAAWCMSGNASPNVSILGGGPLVIHALFTGSIQGIQSVENAQPLVFPTPTLGVYKTNAPTIAFSDSASAATPQYDVNNFPDIGEEQVAVQPFVFCKSLAPSGAVTSIANVTWEQIRYAYLKGRIPFSSWSGNSADANTYVYLLNRTLDSGTRVTTLAELAYPYLQPTTIYNYDPTNHQFYLANNTAFSSVGRTNFGVIGSTAGIGNANLAWGSGYIGGGDLRTGLKYTDVQNQSIGYLSFADAKSAGAQNWSSVIAFGGVWPTAAGAGIAGNTGTNNFAPVINGAYPFWTYEVVVYPINGNADVTATQLGDQSQAGTILGVLDYQTLFSNPGGATLLGSLENEIEASKVAGATAIRLSEMKASRGSVGGTIFPTANP